MTLPLLLAWTVTLLLGPAAATAGEVARYRLDEGELTLLFGDPWHVRAELRGREGPPRILILNEGKSAILPGGAAEAGGPSPLPQARLRPGERTLRARDTGREGSRAGLQGRWFELRLGSGRRQRVLLSRDERLRAIRLGWGYLAGALGPRTGLGDFLTLERLLRHPDLSGWALLEWPGVASLVSLRSGPLADSLFSPSPEPR